MFPGVQGCWQWMRPSVDALATQFRWHLDLILPLASAMEYLYNIQGSQHTEIRNTGHAWLVTKPFEFRDIVVDFAIAHDRKPRGAVQVSA